MANIHPTSVIDPGATLGRDVRVGPFTLVGPGVSIGDGAFVESHCVVGASAAGYYADPGRMPVSGSIRESAADVSVALEGDIGVGEGSLG